MTNKEYYTQIDNAIKSYEEYKPYHQHDIDWICNRIEWCWKWKHITEEEMNNFVDRICYVMEGRC